MEILRLAAFSDGTGGGNPAGVVLCDKLFEQPVMQAVAREVGYSETVFAAPYADGWRVRYFAPAMEIPFCGHATIALGAALAAEHGDGVFPLHLNDGTITVEGRCAGGHLAAALQSPQTRSEPAAEDVVALALNLFSYDPDHPDPRLPPAFVEAGARHLLLALSSRSQLTAMQYDFERGAELMRRWGLATISLMHAETASLFHASGVSAGGRCHCCRGLRSANRAGPQCPCVMWYPSPAAFHPSQTWEQDCGRAGTNVRYGKVDADPSPEQTA